MSSTIFEKLVATLTKKEYDPQVSYSTSGSKKLKWDLEPDRRPEWKDVTFVLKGYAMGDGRYQLGKDSSCEMWFEKDGEISYFSYQISPGFSVCTLDPKEIAKEISDLEKIIGAQLI